MTMRVEGRPAHPVYLHVKCPCGRDLRAKPEQAGGHITCWSCHASVPVPVPVAPGGWVARLLKMAARQVLDPRILTFLIGGALLVTLSLALSSFGLPFVEAWRAKGFPPGELSAALALGVVMAGYGELLRRGCAGDWVRRPRLGPLAIAWHAVLCLGMGFALVLPLFIATARHTMPRLTPSGLAIAAACVVVLPLVMLATYLPSGSVGRRVRVIGSMLRRHPMAVLASLLILPLSLVAIEALVVILSRMLWLFGFMVVDLFPPRDSITILFNTPFYMPSPKRETWVEIGDASDSITFALYGQTLREGYTMLGAIPASLALGKTAGFETFTIRPRSEGYLLARMGLTLLIVVGMLSALAIQARWLGLLSMLDWRRHSQGEAAPD